MVSPIAWGMWRFAGADVAEGARADRGGVRRRASRCSTPPTSTASTDRGGFGDAESAAGRGVRRVAGPARPDGAGDQGRHHAAGPLRFSARLSDARARRIAAAAAASTRSISTRSTAPTSSPIPQEVARDARRRWSPAARSARSACPTTRVAQTARARGVPDRPARQHAAGVLAARISTPIDERAVRPDDGARHRACSPGRRSAAGGSATPTTMRERTRSPPRSMRSRTRPASAAPPPPTAGSWRIRRARSRSSARRTPGRIAELADAFKVRWTRQDWYDVLVASRGEKLP